MPIVIVILIVLLGFMNQQLWLSPDAGRGKVRLLQDAIDVQTDENAKLAERNKTLEAEVLNLKDGLEAIEERARVELGMIRNGETFYHVLEEMPPSPAPVAAPKARRAVKPKATPARAAVKPRND